MKLLNVEIKLNDTNPIIYVDDDELAIYLFSHYYQESGLKTPLLTFLSAEDFFEYLEQIKNKKMAMPAIIFLDINMPVMNGFELLEQLRADPLFLDTPAVSMLTSSEYDKDKLLATELGANDYLVKPKEAKEYLTLFKQLSQKP